MQLVSGQMGCSRVSVRVGVWVRVRVLVRVMLWVMVKEVRVKPLIPDTPLFRTPVIKKLP